MSDDVKDLLDRAAADSLRGVQLDLPTAEDVARWETTSPVSGPGSPSVPETQVIPLDAPRRRARWPLGLAAAVLAVLAIGGGLLAVQTADDPSPATPTTASTGDARERLLGAIDKSRAEAFGVDYSESAGDDALRGPDIAGAETGSVYDGDLAGLYAKGTDGPSPVTKVVTPATAFYQTGPDQWVAMPGGQDYNPLGLLRQAADNACIFDRDGTIVVDLGSRPGYTPPRDPPEQTPCGSESGMRYEVTLDDADRVATVSSADVNPPGLVRFDYTDVPRPRLPDPAQVTTLSNAFATAVATATGYWTIRDVDSIDVGPTTTVTSGGPVPTTSVVTDVGGP